MADPKTALLIAKGVVYLARAARTLKQTKIIGTIRRRAAMNYLSHAHLDFVHPLRKVSLAVERFRQGKTDNALLGAAITELCTGTRRFMCDVLELEDNQLHCCLKVITRGLDQKDSVVTLARSEPLDHRPASDEGSLLESNSIACALMGRYDGKRKWRIYNCFCSQDLCKYSDRYAGTRPSFSAFYKSTLVYPLRYSHHLDGTTHDAIGFLAFDSPKANAFPDLPEIFDHLDEKWADYHNQLRDSATFHAGALLADTITLVLRPFYLTVEGGENHDPYRTLQGTSRSLLGGSGH